MTTIENYRISPLVSLANMVGGGLDRLRLQVTKLTPESLKAAAERETGLSDWGSDDFWPCYDVLIRALDADNTQTLVGRISLRMEVLRRLKNKLLLVQAIKDNPGMTDQPVRQPIFIVGFPRTGTTMLHKLLAQDTRAHMPIYWKLHTPLPLNVPQDQLEARIKSAESLMRFAGMVAPQWDIIHATGAYEAEECVFAMTDSLTYAVGANAPDYVDTYLQADLSPVYANYKQSLQALQWQQPAGHWVLKSPLHLWSVDALLRVFPDALIVQTHRDPKKAFPSWCSLVAALGKMQRKSIDFEQIGEQWMTLWKTGIERAQTAREAANPGQFYDVQYSDLVADPLEAVRQIYQHFGLELSPESEDAMKAWLVDHGSGRDFHHRYSAEQYGFTNDEVEQEFHDYIERFKIRRE